MLRSRNTVSLGQGRLSAPSFYDLKSCLKYPSFRPCRGWRATMAVRANSGLAQVQQGAFPEKLLDHLVSTEQNRGRDR